MSDSIEYQKKLYRIKNSLRSKQRKEVKILPLHMIKRDTHELLTTNIKNNEIFNTLLHSINFDDKYNLLINAINKLYDKNELLSKLSSITDDDDGYKSLIPEIETIDIDYNYCISGSKSWYNIFKDHYETELLSRYEKSAIHNNNTCDHYYFINYNNSIFIKYITLQILNLLNLFIDEINTDLNINVKRLFQDQNKQVQLLASIDNKTYNKLLFKTDSQLLKLSLTISDIVPGSVAVSRRQKFSSSSSASPVSLPVRNIKRKKKVTNKELQIELEKEKQEITAVRQAQKNSRSERASRRDASRGIKPQELMGGTNNDITKSILSFELNFRNPGDTLISKINNIIFDNHYLNVYGLYLFLQFAKAKYFIQRNKYNPFKIREFIYNKYILIPGYKTDTLFRILYLYTTIFKEHNIPNTLLYNELHKNALISNPVIEEYINTIETKIIETLRPFINQTIFNINEEIKSIKFKPTFTRNPIIHGKDITGIFIAGGDAMRRYDYESSITKDIDSKIYIPSEVNINESSNYMSINNCIITNLFKLCIFLNQKSDIFDDINRILLDRRFMATEEHNYNCNIKFELKSPNINNFRFRQIPKSKFPVDLYSLDYRCSIEFTYQYKDQVLDIFKYDYDIAFIDIVLEESENNYYEKYAVLSRGLPISSLEFLLEDLIKTYNNDTSSLLRFINGKSNKDYQRFLLLHKLHKTNIDGRYFTIDSDKNITYKEPNIREKLSLDIKEPYSITANNELLEKYLDTYETFDINKKIIFDYDKSKLQGGLTNLKLSPMKELKPKQKPKQKILNNDDNISKNIYYYSLVDMAKTSYNNKNISVKEELKTLELLTSKYIITPEEEMKLLKKIMTKT